MTTASTQELLKDSDHVWVEFPYGSNTWHLTQWGDLYTVIGKKIMAKENGV